jgi:ABC-type multidrug transport system fused ATPase/permease subunit
MTQQQRKKEVIDPVCGMNVADLTDMGSVSHKGETFSFCNAHCRERFTKTPDKFLKEPLIKLKNIWKVFLMGDTETQVLRDLSLHIWEGDFVAIIGASGSGKSTALNMIGLLDRPTSGDIFFRGKNVLLLEDIERAELRSKTFGFVFQHYNLIPWLTEHFCKKENQSREDAYGVQEDWFAGTNDSSTLRAVRGGAAACCAFTVSFKRSKNYHR